MDSPSSKETTVVEFYEDLVPYDADWTRWTMPHVLRRQAAERGDRTFLIAPEEGPDAQWTYAQVLAEAERIGGGLRAAGVQRGDRVTIMARNSSRFCLTWFGTSIADIVQAPVNTAYEGDFLRHQVTLVEAEWVVCDDTFVDRFIAIADELPLIRKFWVIDTGELDAALERLRAAGWDAVPWEQLREASRWTGPEPDARDLTSIYFTSGTTGLSKGVSMSHAHQYFFAEVTRCMTRFEEDDTYLAQLPLFHGNATYMAIYPAMISGGRAVLRSRFSATRWIDQVREHDVTVTNFLGVMMDFVWKQPPRPDDADNRLRAVFAAPTASSIVDEFRTRFGIEAFVEIFGTTETGAPIITPYGRPRPAGAAGLLADKWYDVALVDPETDVEVTVGQVGEFVVRPRHPWICSLGYYNMPEKNAEQRRNLWYHSGDALRRDADGWYYFVDRLKDAIRRRGENISSYEVEQVVLSHPAVTECAVIGVAADEEAGEEEVMAVVVTNAPVRPEELWDWCTGRVPAFAIPRFVRFVDALPRTPSEKLQRNVLRDEATSAPEVHDRASIQSGSKLPRE
jgi:crotonobetaine/carnitine-CoA ligase